MKKTKTRIVGYGFKRTERSLVSAGADETYIDVSEERPERTDLLTTPACVQEGDTVLLLHPGDLGSSWQDRHRILSALSERGVFVQVHGNDPVLYDSPDKLKAFSAQQGGTATRKDRGRPRLFDPPLEKQREFSAVWHSPIHSMAACRKAFKDAFGEEWSEANRAWVNNHMGPRSKPKPPFDAPLDGDE
jgi:hypothetical protein